ncbi:hypothetical protein HW115_19190 [Verrucomicrobiaceae bacterium N1E253]|uniref:Uncharacterized protein n=1 Tax=Oceaniferula marina TaxID=2748318 RepID=A0A851GL16_9BACT|nr:hypothetical protein [Oceaniferula marina]NWK57752.1 hypothetical protein [Oceaniferula marina]
MLLPDNIAQRFLEQYQTLLRSILGHEPSSLNDWVDARNKLAEVHKNCELNDGYDFDDDFRDGLRNAIYGDFCFLKRYKNYCALQHIDSSVFYGARSLTSPLEEMISEYSIIQTGLIPYQGTIVCDGLVQPSNMLLGKNYAKSMRDAYWSAKRGGELILI